MEYLTGETHYSKSIGEHSRINNKSLKIIINIALFLFGFDIIYKLIFGITYQNRQSCFLYGHLPRWGFMIIENIVELALVVIAGIFAASLLEKHIARMKRFIPGNIFTAFIYASVIPVCSCSAIPLIRPLREKIPFHVIMTFILAAPILNPYIIVLSLSILGLKYTILRIAGSFIMTVGAALVAAHFARRWGYGRDFILPGCASAELCHGRLGDVYESTYRITKIIFPYILAAGIIGIFFEYFLTRNLLEPEIWGDGYAAIGLAILIGVPLYMCSGADVVFLQPLLQYGRFPMGAAVVFSLTSTAVCVSSLILMSKYVGRRITLIIMISIIVIALLFGTAIQLWVS